MTGTIKAVAFDRVLDLPGATVTIRWQAGVADPRVTLVLTEGDVSLSQMRHIVDEIYVAIANDRGRV